MKKLFHLLFITVFLLLPFTANANIIWPSMYIEQGMLSRMVIVPWLIIEFFFIKIFTKKSRVKSGIMAITMNAISTIVGLIGIPLSGLGVEIIMWIFGSVRTFDISHRIIAFLVAIAFNVVIEGLSLKRIFTLKFKKIYWWLAIANAISIIICAFLLRFKIIPVT